MIVVRRTTVPKPNTTIKNQLVQPSGLSFDVNENELGGLSGSVLSEGAMEWGRPSSLDGSLTDIEN